MDQRQRVLCYGQLHRYFTHYPGCSNPSQVLQPPHSGYSNPLLQGPLTHSFRVLRPPPSVLQAPPPVYSNPFLSSSRSATNGGRDDATPLRNGEPLYAERTARTSAMSMTNVQQLALGISVSNVYVDRDVHVL